MSAQRRPGILKLLVAELRVTVRAAISGPSDAKGMCCSPGNTRSECISSDMTTRSCSMANWPNASNSSRENTRPVGFCGLQSTKIRVRLLTSFSSSFMSKTKRVPSSRIGKKLALRRVDGVAERRIVRGLQNDAVAGLGECQDRRIGALYEIRERQHKVRRELPSVAGFHPLGERTGDQPVRLFTTAQRTAVVAVSDDPLDRGLDRGGNRKIHVGDKGRQYIRIVLVPFGIAACLQSGLG